MTRARRLLIAGISLTLALFVFHAQVASAIVTRGDDVLRTGDVAGAIRFYQRAISFDPRSAVAADRFAFYLSVQHDRESARRAVDVVTAALRAGASDSALYADRAFAELQLHAWRDAELDFAQAGAASHDARYEHFAARLALRLADRPAADRYARLALNDDPSFAPARAFMRALR